MEVRRQRCQKCGSPEARNIIVRAEGQPQTVYVRCVGCGDLVAMYRLMEYYHHGKGIESYLRSRGAGSAESGRSVLKEFERIAGQAEAGYAAALEWLAKAGKPLDDTKPSEPGESR